MKYLLLWELQVYPSALPGPLLGEAGVNAGAAGGVQASSWASPVLSCVGMSGEVAGHMWKRGRMLVCGSRDHQRGSQQASMPNSALNTSGS